ncbi:C-reactive protein-like [Paroedura picta]|uniref:C-reactive protein-like n=1 Tax=Paroedura picta TaxID=143630 RepID=UPI004056D23D
MLPSLLLLLVSLWGSLAQEDLEKKAFVFPVASDTAHVALKATIPHALTSFSMCMRFYTDLTRGYSLFSYASHRNANEVLLFAETPNQYGFYLGQESVLFDIPESLSTKLGGKHVCVSWDKHTSLVELWLNGHPFVRKRLVTEDAIDEEASILLGQDQDTFRGGFDRNQSFVGEITDVYVWDRVLYPEEVALALYNHPLPQYLINWNALNYSITGTVFVKPALFSFHKAGRACK